MLQLPYVILKSKVKSFWMTTTELSSLLNCNPNILGAFCIAVDMSIAVDAVCFKRSNRRLNLQGGAR